MAKIQFLFKGRMNQSLQIGDVVYYTPTTTTANFNTADQEDIEKVGVVSDVTSTFAMDTPTDINEDELNEAGTLVTCTIEDGVSLEIGEEDYFFFSKDNAVNLSSILGYYGEVKFKNNSTTKAELFSAACEISESSK